jgi:protein TonB
VTGDNVVPPRPDARFHNKAPVYPDDAVRRHAQGVVGVRIHVTETGTPVYVDVIHSSGDASLDNSVREAVMLWRFQPASDHGSPVPFDSPMNFDFSMKRP